MLAHRQLGSDQTRAVEVPRKSRLVRVSRHESCEVVELTLPADESTILAALRACSSSLVSTGTSGGLLIYQLIIF